MTKHCETMGYDSFRVSCTKHSDSLPQKKARQPPNFIGSCPLCYCWGKKLCAMYPVNHGIFTISTGAGFLPSTVSLLFFPHKIVWPSVCVCVCAMFVCGKDDSWNKIRDTPQCKLSSVELNDLARKYLSCLKSEFGSNSGKYVSGQPVQLSSIESNRVCFSLAVLLSATGHPGSQQVQRFGFSIWRNFTSISWNGYFDWRNWFIYECCINAFRLVWVC